MHTLYILFGFLWQQIEYSLLGCDFILAGGAQSVYSFVPFLWSVIMFFSSLLQVLAAGRSLGFSMAALTFTQFAFGGRRERAELWSCCCRAVKFFFESMIGKWEKDLSILSWLWSPLFYIRCDGTFKQWNVFCTDLTITMTCVWCWISHWDSSKGYPKISSHTFT